MKRNRNCCCCDVGSSEGDTDARASASAARPDWQAGTVAGPTEPIPLVSCVLSARDRLGAVRVRLGIARCCYRVEPGLYAVGSPNPGSPVFVSANYKLSFDHLRSALHGRSGWILVLDTDGINVWCAAGKGTFGTRELVRRIAAVELHRVVEHRDVTVPQLGATGVAAHRVVKESGFNVVYGPVRAADLPAFLDAGCQAKAEMRRVTFELRDRAAVVPTELVMWGALAVPAVLLLTLLGQRLLAGVLLGAFLAGTVVAPLLLPWLPGKSFSVKGVWLGAVPGLAVACAAAGTVGTVAAAGLFLLMVSLSSFFALNFTGCTTFTSLSGTRYETLRALPPQALGSLVGVTLWCWSLWS